MTFLDGLLIGGLIIMFLLWLASQIGKWLGQRKGIARNEKINKQMEDI